MCAPCPENAGGHRLAGTGEMDDTHCLCARPKEISNPGARPPSSRVGIAPLQPARS